MPVRSGWLAANRTAISLAAVFVVIGGVAMSANTEAGVPRAVTSPSATSAVLTAAPLPTTAKATTRPATDRVPARPVRGTATTLGSGAFTGGKQVKVGTYDVTPAAGQSGDFIVSGVDGCDEILGRFDGAGVPTVRTTITAGDQIEISGLSRVRFTPVTSPYVTDHTTAHLYAGTWLVGKDIGPGTYVATTTTGSTGNLMVNGDDTYDRILGTDAGVLVPYVTVSLDDNDVIQISGLSQVTMTAVN